MSKRWIKRNSTSQSIDIFIPNSSSTTGAGLTGLVFNSAGLTCAQRVGNAAAAAITLATLTLPTSAYSSGGFKEVDSSLMPGVYRFDIPNAQLTTAGILILYFKGATNMAPVVVEIEVTEIDIYDVIRGGLTAIPNVAQGSSGSLPTGSATGQVTVATNNDKTGYALSGTQTFNMTGSITGSLSGSVGSIGTGGITSSSIATDAITSTGMAASAIAEIADGILARKLDSSGNETSTTASERTVRNALRILRNKVDASSGTAVNVYDEADTSIIWSMTITTSSTAYPITKVG